MDWSLGVDSGKVKTLASPSNPNGLKRNQLAWLENGTVRNGAISPRTGWLQLVTLSDTPAPFGGAFMYQPPADELPYPIVVLGGNVYAVRVDLDNSVELLNSGAGLAMPALNTFHFAQAEEFLVIQAGDGTTAPLFFARGPGIPTLTRRSLGLAGGELPPATCMDYYQGRLWYAQNRNYMAGDIIYGAAGTAAYGTRDAVLHVTENPLVVGGDGFSVPASDGIIRALAHTANMNTQLGEGQLYVFTRGNIYSLTVPATRDDWIAMTADKMPNQTVVQRRYGAVGDRCVVPMNGDLYYATSEPGIRSLAIALRGFQQFGNTPISRNLQRLLQTEDRSLMRYGKSGVNFDNRLLMAAQPYDIPGVGTACKAIAALDFTIVSSFEDKLQDNNVPAWEGDWCGLNILQLLEGDFGGRDRCFAVVYAEQANAIQLWELTDYSRTNSGDKRTAWYFETPAFTWAQDGGEFGLKELDGAEIWFDDLSGTVEVNAYYYVDQDPCPVFWTAWNMCSARDSTESAGNSYPTVEYCDGQRFPVTLPKPPARSSSSEKRPSNVGFQFSLRLEIKGWCRVRGILLYAQPRGREPFPTTTMVPAVTLSNGVSL